MFFLTGGCWTALPAVQLDGQKKEVQTALSLDNLYAGHCCNGDDANIVVQSEPGERRSLRRPR